VAQNKEKYDIQGFPKFLAGGEFRRFKIKQIDLIQKIEKSQIRALARQN